MTPKAGTFDFSSSFSLFALSSDKTHWVSLVDHSILYQIRVLGGGHGKPITTSSVSGGHVHRWVQPFFLLVGITCLFIH